MVVVVVVGGGGCCCCCCCCLSHLQVVALYRVGTLPATVLVLLIKDIKRVIFSHWQYNMRHASAKKLLLLLLLLLLLVVVACGC